MTFLLVQIPNLMWVVIPLREVRQLESDSSSQSLIVTTKNEVSGGRLRGAASEEQVWVVDTFGWCQPVLAGLHWRILVLTGLYWYVLLYIIRPHNAHNFNTDHLIHTGCF